ncbi:MAG: hypothetical protein K8R63_00140 [Bacteroidales bacterium]|nr:hypothetical protein [Bacteroidales bacterium]
MKKSKLFYLLGIVLVSTALVFSSCKKDDDPAPAPPVVDPCDTYLPTFSPTYLVIPGTPEMLDFYITCTTDDWEMIKVIVTYPGGLGSNEYLGSGQLMTSGSPFTFSNYFPKLGGTWIFAITGNIKSGNCVNKSFTVTVSSVVTGK